MNRYSWRMLGMAVLSAVLALGSGYARKHGLVPPALLWFVVLLPVLPMIGYFVGIGGWLRSLDELQRQIQLEALLIQFGVTGVFVMSYGLLAKVGMVRDLPISHSWPWIWLALFLSWALGQLVVGRKYR